MKQTHPGLRRAGAALVPSVRSDDELQLTAASFPRARSPASQRLECSKGPVGSGRTPTVLLIIGAITNIAKDVTGRPQYISRSPFRTANLRRSHLHGEPERGTLECCPCLSRVRSEFKRPSFAPRSAPAPRGVGGRSGARLGSRARRAASGCAPDPQIRTEDADSDPGAESCCEPAAARSEVARCTRAR